LTRTNATVSHNTVEYEDDLDRVIRRLVQLKSLRFFGTISLQVQSGRIVQVRTEQTEKVEELT
jgi:hypothetical protein